MTNNKREMNNPFLRRAVWLDDNQRSLLCLAVESAMLNTKSDSILCNSILKEIKLSELEFMRNKNSLVLGAIHGLRLPRTALPIYLCHVEIEEVLTYTKIDISTIKEILNAGSPNARG
jgi:hypothetical protein